MILLLGALCKTTEISDTEYSDVVRYVFGNYKQLKVNSHFRKTLYIIKLFRWSHRHGIIVNIKLRVT
jgi:hypothetical protein